MLSIRPLPLATVVFLLLSSLLLIDCPLWGDQIEMQNGERYLGTVLSLTNDTVVVQSDLLGTVRLPRSKVAVITLGHTATNMARPLPATFEGHAVASHPAKANEDISAALRQLGGNTNFIQGVQEQLLSSAGPEANAKYKEMVNGLMSGQLNLKDIQVQALSAANQLRTLKKDMGDDAGGVLDGYLTILDTFLRETASQGKDPTNSLPVAPGKKPAPIKEDE